MKTAIVLALHITVLTSEPERAWSADTEVLPLASLTIYNESYAPIGTPTVVTRGFTRGSNRLLVGLHLGHAWFSLDELAAAVPSTAPAKNFCVKLTTRDARYWSLNLYRRPDDKATVWRLETRSKFAAELSQRYSAQDVAIRVFAAHDCNADAEGPLVAAIPPGAVAQDVLVLYLNAVGSRAAVRLLDHDGKPLATASCSLAPRDSVIAYTEICDVPLAGINRAQVTKIQFTLIGEDATKAPITADLQLPAR